MVQRVHDHLIEQVETFDGSLRALGRVIADLDTAWSTESGWSEEKRRMFRLEWGILEQIYAGALAPQATALDSDDEDAVRLALKRAASMLPG
jgi:hypothetical protein